MNKHCNGFQPEPRGGMSYAGHCFNFFKMCDVVFCNMI